MAGGGLLYWFGIWIPNEPSRTALPVRGIDVSHHQGVIDWPAVKNAGTQFVYIKATEGADFKDADFGRNWKGSAGVVIPHGAYHFFTLGTSGSSQAANFISVVPVEPEALPPAIDLEFSGYNLRRRPSRDEFARELSVFYDAIVARYQKVPVIYTAYNFRNDYLKSMPVERLWIREIFTKPRLGSAPWTFWQFSARGKVPGISTPADLDVFNGNAETFTRFLKQERGTADETR